MRSEYQVAIQAGGSGDESLYNRGYLPDAQRQPHSHLVTHTRNVGGTWQRKQECLTTNKRPGGLTTRGRGGKGAGGLTTRGQGGKGAIGLTTRGQGGKGAGLLLMFNTSQCRRPSPSYPVCGNVAN